MISVNPYSNDTRKFMRQKEGAESYVSVVSFGFYLKHQVFWERMKMDV